MSTFHGILNPSGAASPKTSLAAVEKTAIAATTEPFDWVMTRIMSSGSDLPADAPRPASLPAQDSSPPVDRAPNETAIAAPPAKTFPRQDIAHELRHREPGSDQRPGSTLKISGNCRPQLSVSTNPIPAPFRLTPVRTLTPLNHLCSSTKIPSPGSGKKVAGTSEKPASPTPGFSSEKADLPVQNKTAPINKPATEDEKAAASPAADLPPPIPPTTDADKETAWIIQVTSGIPFSPPATPARETAAKKTSDSASTSSALSALSASATSSGPPNLPEFPVSPVPQENGGPREERPTVPQKNAIGNSAPTRGNSPAQAVAKKSALVSPLPAQEKTESNSARPILPPPDSATPSLATATIPVPPVAGEHFKVDSNVATRPTEPSAHDSRHQTNRVPDNSSPVPSSEAHPTVSVAPAEPAKVPDTEESAIHAVTYPLLETAHHETKGATPSQIHGTAAALKDVPMNKAEKTNKIAGSNGKTEKVLPVNGTSAVSRNNLPPTTRARFSPDAKIEVATSSSPVSGFAPAAAGGPDGLASSSIIDLRSRALERAQDMLAVHAVRMVDSNLDSLRVVIKPGAGLQLAIDMRQHNGAIDAQVVVQQGDSAHLSQHWPDLQQRLEQRGIHLADLETGTPGFSSNSDPEHSHQPPEFNHADPLAASAFAAFALAGHNSMSSTPSPRILDFYNGWESWA